jgi:hypothetical protein
MPAATRRGIAIGTGVVALIAVAIASYAQFGRPAPSPTPRLPPSPIVGVVVLVDQESLSEVSSFDVRTPGGTTVTLDWGPIDNAVEFSPSHLATHMATGVPIRAYYRLQGGRPVVYHLEDAEASSPGPTAPPGAS